MTEEKVEAYSLERSLGRVEGKLDSVITEIGHARGEVKSLRDDFGSMEKGRLSTLEVRYATLETTVSLKAKNSAMVWAAVMSIAASVVAALVIRFLI